MSEILGRQAELRARLNSLGGNTEDPGQLDPVFDAADRLLDVVDGIEAGLAGRLRWIAFGLLILAAGLTGLVVFSVLPAAVLVGSLLALVAGAGLLFVIRHAL